VEKRRENGECYDNIAIRAGFNSISGNIFIVHNVHRETPLDSRAVGRWRAFFIESNKNEPSIHSTLSF